MQRVTIMDVAAKAGVSHATVERVIHNKGYASESATKKVNDAIQELGYTTNWFASGLKRKKSGLICHLGVLSGNQVFERVSASLAINLKSYGYTVMNIPIMYEKDKQIHIMDELDQIPFEGIVTSSIFSVDKSGIKRFQKNKIPLVMIERGLEASNVDKIIFDDYDGAVQAVQYLLESNCKKIAFIGWNDEKIKNNPLLMTEYKRLMGYQDTMEKIGMKPIYGKVADYDRLSGYKCAESLFHKEKELDGIYAGSDILLSGVIQYIEQNKEHLSKKIKVVGTDNSIAKFMPYSIPSLEFDYDMAAKEASKMLIKRIEDPTKKSEAVKLAVKLNLNQAE